MDENKLNTVIQEEKPRFTFDALQKSIKGMIATNDRTYTVNPFFDSFETLRNYTEQEISTIISEGTPTAKKDLSNFHFITNGVYRRIIIYYATLFKYQGLLIPHSTNSGGIFSGLNKKRTTILYDKALEFIETIGFKDLCTRFALKCLLNGTYYGVLRLTGNKVNIIDLPFAYCRSRFKSPAGEDLIEFNLQYFTTIFDETLRKETFAAYPKYFKKYYDLYLAGKMEAWFFIPEQDSVCFRMYEGFPLFLSVIPSTINFEEYQVIEKERDMNEIKKILVQKIPITNEGEPVFEPDEAEEIHKGSVEMLKANKNVSVLTTYAEVDLQGMTDARQALNRNLDKMEKAIFVEAGTTKNLFAADGNLAIDTSLQNDLALMTPIVNKFGAFFQNLINRIYGNDKLSFSYIIFPISHYNQKQFIEDSYKLAGSGYSAILPALAIGLSQRDLVDLKFLENDILDLPKLLIPIMSAYNSGTNGAPGTAGKNGRPTLETKDKQQKTLNNESAANKSGNGGE